jgi:hypothetical protein
MNILGDIWSFQWYMLIYIYVNNLKLIRIIVLKYHFQYLLLFNAKNKVHLVSIQSSIIFW